MISKLFLIFYASLTKAKQRILNETSKHDLMQFFNKLLSSNSLICLKKLFDQSFKLYLNVLKFVFFNLIFALDSFHGNDFSFH